MQPQGGDAVVSARVWATFPRDLYGRFVGWVFVHLLNGEEKDREHARAELRYLKHIIEDSSHSQAVPAEFRP